ncbi:MAG: hypothetical protein KF822_06900 [Steroidobacteraceae bacterium]|nr:hypothetical protein [Steroidobacteraceae bacterium]
MAGYSGTPLAAKLGIQPGMAVRAVNAPKDYRQLLAPLPGGARIAAGRVAAGLVHHFTTRRAELAAALKSYRRQLGDDIPLWVSWPKKSAKLPTDVTEDTIRELALPLGYVDVKVCAVSDVWSGLKLVVRRELRGKEGK